MSGIPLTPAPPAAPPAPAGPCDVAFVDRPGWFAHGTRVAVLHRYRHAAFAKDMAVIEALFMGRPCRVAVAASWLAAPAAPIRDAALALALPVWPAADGIKAVPADALAWDVLDVLCRAGQALAILEIVAALEARGALDVPQAERRTLGWYASHPIRRRVAAIVAALHEHRMLDDLEAVQDCESLTPGPRAATPTLAVRCDEGSFTIAAMGGCT